MGTTLTRSACSPGINMTVEPRVTMIQVRIWTGSRGPRVCVSTRSASLRANPTNEAVSMDGNHLSRSIIGYKFRKDMLTSLGISPTL
eukprot:1159954-Pelagomonas_calceolata.AAC.1